MKKVAEKTQPRISKNSDKKFVRTITRVNKADNESVALEKIAEMSAPYRAMGEKLHALIMTSAPTLTPKTWYGMPAYTKNDRIICFFRSGEKFKERYMTLGFNQDANLDAGNMWPIAFAVTALTPTEETRISALVKKAAS